MAALGQAKTQDGRHVFVLHVLIGGQHKRIYGVIAETIGDAFTEPPMVWDEKGRLLHGVGPDLDPWRLFSGLPPITTGPNVD